MTNHQDEVLRYEISLVTQGKHRFYSLTMPSDVLAETCFVTNRYDDPKLGFQRLLDKERAKQIAEYIDSGFGTIPNSIVLSAQPLALLQVVRRGKAIQFHRTNKAFLILDGQHRVYGFSLAKTNLRVPVVIYNGLTKTDETRLFIDINTKQRPVPNELLLDIKKQADYESDAEQLLREIYDSFNGDPASTLLGLMSPADKVKGKISRVTFNASVKPLLKVFVGTDAPEMYRILNSYLTSFVEGTQDLKLQNVLTNPTAFRSVMLLFPDVARLVKDRYGKVYTPDNFSQVSAPIFRRVSPSKLEKPGTSSTLLHKTLLNALRSDFTL